MKKEKIVVAVIPASTQGKAPYMKIIPNTLEAFQEEVGGYIEVVPLGMGAVMVVNEEGKISGLEYNCDFFQDEICGNIVVCGEEGEEFSDCPQLFLDILNIVNVGWSFMKLKGIKFIEPYRSSAVTLALESMRNAEVL